MAENDRCAECGMHVGSGQVFHPFLYCVMFKGGIRDPRAYLLIDPTHIVDGMELVPRVAAGSVVGDPKEPRDE